MTLTDHIAQQSGMLQIWIYWMMLINLSSVFYVWTRVEARWVLFAFFCSALMMNVLYGLYGYEKVLGAAHIVFWTPLILYLFARRRQIGREGVAALYFTLVFATNLISLFIDGADVFAWLTSP